jgi:hypothetical protein
MKKVFFIPLVILLFAGCQKEMNSDNKAQNDVLSQTNKASKKQARPISGDLSNAAVPGAEPVSCSGIFPVSGQNFIYGNVSHLGRLKSGSLGIAQECNITNFVTYLDLSISFKEIYVAANGDKLFSSVTIDIIGDPLTSGATGTWTGSNIITGGTGRFEGATGHWDQLNGKYFANGTATWSILGEITY